MSSFRSLSPNPSSSNAAATRSERNDERGNEGIRPPRPEQALPSIVPPRTVEDRRSIPKQKFTLLLPTIKESTGEHAAELTGRIEAIHPPLREESSPAPGFTEEIRGIENILTKFIDGNDISGDDIFAALAVALDGIQKYGPQSENEKLQQPGACEIATEEIDPVSNEAKQAEDIARYNTILMRNKAIYERNEVMANEINDLILERCLNEQPCSARVLNILHCAAGGRNLFPDILHPEIGKFSKILIELPNDERLACLTALATRLDRFLSPKLNFKINAALRLITDANTSKYDQAIRNGRLRRLQNVLWDLINQIVISDRGYAPRTDAMLAKRIGDLITTYPHVKQNGTARALKIIYCAAGGRIHVDSEQPETDVEAKNLQQLPNTERLKYLQELYRILRLRFTVTQQGIIEEHLSGNIDFFNLRQALRQELFNLDVEIPFQIK